VKTATEVARIGGSPGQFNVTFKGAGESTEWDAPARVTVEQQDLISKGELEDPNKGL
jgi:quinone-modifying oxidoreductase, subunit QmoB